MQLRHYFALFTAIIAVVFLVSSQPVPAKSATDTPARTTKKVATSSSNSQSGSKTAGKININTASAKTLTQLAGIGPKTANNIVAYRKKHGKFKKIDDLLQVKGIGEKTLKKIKSRVRL